MTFMHAIVSVLKAKTVYFAVWNRGSGSRKRGGGSGVRQAGLSLAATWAREARAWDGCEGEALIVWRTLRQAFCAQWPVSEGGSVGDERVHARKGRDALAHSLRTHHRG